MTWTSISLPTGQKDRLYLHAAVSHMEKPNRYIWMLFVGYSSVFRSIVPSQLINKLHAFGLINSLHVQLVTGLSYHIPPPQSERLDKHTPSTLTLSTGVPQGCVLSPVLYAFFFYYYYFFYP